MLLAFRLSHILAFGLAYTAPWQASNVTSKSPAPAVFEIDPLIDPRWPELLQRHNHASVFHSPEWLQALRQTYGYSPAAVVTSGPDGKLVTGLAFCRVHSWLTGRRLVSVPFSDHCTPLVDDEQQLGKLVLALGQNQDVGYIEIRAIGGFRACPANFTTTSTYCLHRLDLRDDLSVIYQRCHPNHVRRKVGRAVREGLIYEEGRSEILLRKFHHLAAITRRRQGLPPQPLSWFRNLVGIMGERAKIRLVSTGGQPAAGILTLQYKRTMVYKYGASDTQYHRLGPMQLLLWTAIEEAKNTGLFEFDFGRSDWDNSGLLVFKDRWGASRCPIVYVRSRRPHGVPRGGLSMALARPIVAITPTRLLSLAGALLYRHIG